MVTKQKAFTLIEILVATAIVSLLAALVIPAALEARRSALRASCISNLRQCYAALALYTGDYGAEDFRAAPPHMDGLQLYARDPRVFKCPDEHSLTPDPDGLYPVKLLDINAFGPKTTLRISYAYLHDYEPADDLRVWGNIVDQSISVGLFACPWHGDISNTLGADSPAWRYLNPRTGPVLRVAADGHLVKWQRLDTGAISTMDLFYRPESPKFFLFGGT